VGKLKRRSSGFSATKATPDTKPQSSKSSKDHAAKEQQAAELINQDKLQDAEELYRELIAEGNNNHVVYGNLAAVYGMQGRYNELINLLKKALDLKPNYPEAHNNMGLALQRKGDLAAAITSYKKALDLKANYPDAHINLGLALEEKGDLDAAISSYSKALELDPSDADAHKNLSMAELLTGNYKSGWERYEYRFECKKGQGILTAKPKCPRLNKGIHFKDTQLILVAEQGLGDTLQFMRYVIVLRNQEIAVSLCAQPTLHGLIRASGIHHSPLTPQQVNQVKDCQWIPLLSVPKHLGVSPDNPIISEPYIKTTEELSAKWKNILSEEQRPIIGINWQGNPSHEKSNSIGRSLPLETFAPIANKTNASLLSLQKGFGSEQVENCSFKDRFVSCQAQISETWDFLETAAIIANCDLVITSDTSVAHLAGGMGKNIWLLLKKVPEWRWGLEGDTSFWYPSMRLFRQSERGNWDEVMARVAKQLLNQFGPTLSPQAASKPLANRQKAQDNLAPAILYLPNITKQELFQFLGKRMPTIKTCFLLLKHCSDLSILELGTTRSFKSGRIETKDFDINPANWDWGAGCFTAAIKMLLPTAQLTSVDPNETAIKVSKTLATAIGAEVNYHQTDSTGFLRSTEEAYDLIYMDHAEAGTSDACATLHREDAEIIKIRNLVKKDGLILIDDTQEKFNKGMYSIPYLRDSGFTQISYNCHQVLFRRDF